MSIEVTQTTGSLSLAQHEITVVPGLVTQSLEIVDSSVETSITGALPCTEGAVADDDTIVGDGTAGSPLQIADPYTEDWNQKLDSDYAVFRMVDNAAPPLPSEGGSTHFTRQYLVGSVKYTEHVMVDSAGEETITYTKTETI